MDNKSHSGEISMLLENGEKVILIIKQPENLAELYSSVLQKVKLAMYEIGQLAEVISNQSVEGAVGFLLTSYSKKQEERNESKKELLSKSEPELKDQ